MAVRTTAKVRPIQGQPLCQVQDAPAYTATCGHGYGPRHLKNGMSLPW